MKFKSKLMLTCSMFVFVIFSLVAGVFAVTTLNFNIGGSIKFTAKGINATISKGTLSATGSHVTSTDSTNKMKQIVLSTTTEDPNHSTNVSSWAGLNLLFNENGDDVTISFSIKNDAKTGSTETVYTKITATPGAGAVNATISASPETASIAPQETKAFTITFHVSEKSLNAELPNFAITVELAMEAFLASSLSFDDYISGQNTVSVSGVDTNVTSVEIPEKVTKDGTEYSVTTIKSNAFAGNTMIEEITIPQSVVVIEPKAFVECTNLTRITFANSSSWYATTSATSTRGTAVDLSNATNNVAELLGNARYLKRGSFNPLLSLTITRINGSGEGTGYYYLMFESGMTWQQFINDTELNIVTNSFNSLIGQIVTGGSYVGYQDAEHSFDEGGWAPAPATFVGPSDVIDANANYEFFSEVSISPYFLIIE